MAMCPEVQLLVACARTTHSAANIARIRQLSTAALDWAVIYDFALRSHTDPLLYRSLNTICPNNVPPSILEQLKDRFVHGTYCNLLISAEMLRVLEVLNGQGIPAATFKGPLLAIQAYGDLALRRFSDVDILIHHTDMWDAKELLLQNNYKQYYTFSASEEHAFIHASNDFPMRHMVLPVLIELQWAVMHKPIRFPYHLEEWWSRFESVQINGQTVQTFSPEDLLLILCAHGCKHLWQRLGWVCDVAEHLRSHPHIQWSIVLERATQIGGRRMLFMGLFLASTLLDAEVPAELIQLVRNDRVAVRLAEQCLNVMFRNHTMPDTADEEAPLYYIHMRERWRERLLTLRYFSSSLLHPLRVLRKYRLDLFKPLLDG